RLEIAETLITTNPEQAVEILDWLKSLNVSLALDEFGVSFSSLSYWHRLPIDSIKIDRSLINLNEKDRTGATVLKTVLNMAHELGKDVVAVGIDTEEDMAYVRALGFDYGQGFFFSEMMTEKEVVNLLNAIARSTRREDRERMRQDKKKARKAAKEKAREKEAAASELPPPEAIREGIGSFAEPERPSAHLRGRPAPGHGRPDMSPGMPPLVLPNAPEPPQQLDRPRRPPLLRDKLNRVPGE